MKRILVPTDFSESANQAVKFALNLASKNRGEVMLLHVVDLPAIDPTFLNPTAYLDTEFTANLSANAKKQFEKIKSKNPEANLTTTIEFGNPTMAILRASEDWKADGIIMGTTGATGLKEFLIGSNAEKIVRNSKVPVISLPIGVKPNAIKNIVFPNSLREDSEALTLKVKSLQEFFKATLHIVFVNTPGRFMRDSETTEALTKFAKRYMFKNYKIHVYNDISEEEGAINFTRDFGGDMIALGTHGRRGLSHLFTGSIAEDIVNHVKYPIWTYRVK